VLPLIWCFVTDQIFVLRWEILTFYSIKFEINFIFDLYGCIFRAVVLLISSSVVTFRVNYIREDINVKRFIIVVLLFILSINFLVFIPNLIALLLGWDGLGIVSFILVIYYRNSNSLAAGIVTALANRVGDVILIIAISWIILQGHWNILTIFDSSYSYFLVFLILVGAMTKRAQIPFRRWLPAAIAAPTPVSALVHSSTLVTAGVFLLIRFYPFLEKTLWFNTVCLAIASLTCFIAGLCALQEFDIKKIIALSTLRQLGVIITSLGLGAVIVAYFHIVTHALFKALLFICAGNVIHQHGGSQDIRFIGNLFRRLPITASCLNIANLALCGLPFIAGFYSKDLILEIFFIKRETLIIVILVIIRTILTLMYSIRFSIIIVWGGHKKYSLFGTGDEDKNVVLSEQVLSIGAILGGAFFSWILFPYPNIIILTRTQKIIIIIGLACIILIFFFLDKIISFRSRFLKNSPIFTLRRRLRTMWFLSVLFPKISTNLGLKIGKLVTRTSDQGWSELLGGQGALIVSSKFIFEVKESQEQIVSLFLFIRFLTLIFLIILM
jgi:NADH-ubiquinone oxidoreductase chain 5